MNENKDLVIRRAAASKRHLVFQSGNITAILNVVCADTEQGKLFN